MKKVELVKNLLTELEDKSINLTAWKAKALIILNSLSLNLPTAYAQVCAVNEVMVGSNERKNARSVFKSILEGCVIVLEMQGEDILLHS